jgi:hypothetical protein
MAGAVLDGLSRLLSPRQRTRHRGRGPTVSTIDLDDQEYEAASRKALADYVARHRHEPPVPRCEAAGGWNRQMMERFLAVLKTILPPPAPGVSWRDDAGRKYARVAKVPVRRLLEVADAVEAGKAVAVEGWPDDGALGVVSDTFADCFIRNEIALEIRVPPETPRAKRDTDPDGWHPVTFRIEGEPSP